MSHPASRTQQWLFDISQQQPQQHAILQAVRQHILSLAPGIQEDIKYGGILFADQQPFCGLFAYRAHVSLEFSAGAQLADPHQVLEGSGKLRRHIKLHSLDEVGRKQVAAYLQAAWQQQAP